MVCIAKHKTMRMILLLRTFQMIAMSISFSACVAKAKLKSVTKLSNYPSASAIEFFNKQFFIMGDDARHMVILSNKLEMLGTIPLYTYNENRIPKNIKGDIEAITVTKDNHLLLLGSGSLPPYRNGGWLIDPLTKQVDSFRLDTLYNRLQKLGMTTLNIEGVCAVPGFLLLANRGNNAWRHNDLILVDESALSNQQETPIAIIRLGANIDSTVFSGVSGLAYAAQSDELLISMSTENTSSTIGDGAIGKSYLWVIKNFSTKTKRTTIEPDLIIDLEKVDGRFTGEKIESVCVVRETKKLLQLALTADNDNGSSTIFQITVTH